MAADGTEFIGLIIPGGWEEFFRFIGEPYAGPLYPTDDKRNPMEVLVPKLIAATEKFDMIPKRDHKGAEAPQPWSEADHVLPTGNEPYYLKSNQGPKYAAGGLLVRPMATDDQSNAKFNIGKIEGSNLFKETVFSQTKSLCFEKAHHGFYVEDGKMNFKIDDVEAEVSAGETIFVPAGSSFSFEITSRYATSYVFSNGGGIVEMLRALEGQASEPYMQKAEGAVHNKEKWQNVQNRLKLRAVPA